MNGVIKENGKDTLVQVQEILDFIRFREKTISEISSNLEIPKATAYRKVNKLVELGWIAELEEQRGFEGKKYLAIVRIQKN
ncbi:MAG: winged helix-turn-helix transcriptional regulator [Thermoplasmata archaeon]|nr:winged helix-turn-helix transcriptional regulator [Thermoplasmata archaeon]